MREIPPAVGPSLGERLLAMVLLTLLAPLMLLTALGIRLSSPGPALYRAQRIGQDGRPFTMLKFRSMQTDAGGAPITAGRDPRIFPFGAFIRLTKLDELPQLVNIVLGEMRFVGPRPEDVTIVERHYRGWMRKALAVPPGLTSIGSIYEYALAEPLQGTDLVERYARQELPKKLAMEIAYARLRHPCKAWQIVLCTAIVIAQRALRRKPTILPGLCSRILARFA